MCVSCSRNGKLLKFSKNALAMVMSWAINCILLRQSEVDEFDKWEYRNANLQSVKYNNHGETKQ